MATLTPMMQQYKEIKEQYKDCILFFRLGDFYEMFFEDAQTASKELEITLTARDCGLSEKAPMCGVPFHSAESYISRLINKGYKVAICEQVEDAALAKGLVKRDVVRVVTPGTVTETSMLEEKKNNYLMAIYRQKYFGIAVVDISTGEMYSTNINLGNLENKLLDEISKFSPTEIIVNSEVFYDTSLINKIKNKFDVYISRITDESFEVHNAKTNIKNQFGDIDFLEDEFDLSINAVGGLLEYLKETQKMTLTHIQNLSKYKIEEYMILDSASRKNLELTETMRDKTKKGSLLWVLDKTMTSMGGRTMRKWIDQPLVNISDIQDRLDSIEEIKNDFMLRAELRESLKGVYDIERLSGKVVIGNVNCRDLICLKCSIGKIPYIKDLISNCSTGLNKSLYNALDPLIDVYELINNSIIDEPPVTVKEGGIIKAEFDEEVNKLRKATTEGKQWIAELENSERQKTGIKNLKVGFNKVFGYYIEVTKSNYSLVPQSYIRKQTLANCERYITQELKEIENTILGAEQKLIDLEYQIFLNIKEQVAQVVNRIKQSARALSDIDVICSLAEVAECENYTKPNISNDGEINIIDGRHPVVEKTMGDNEFVPNDTILDLNDNRLSIITGPNMAGKSTYMRQVALIVLMTQIGSFVPAKSADIGLTDRIFTRVGASDDLASGQSTFMVEMTEVANILNNATSKSLLILDEIGRGTSTFDGLSIAWAVIEFVSDAQRLGSRTLFATHYHELTELEGKLTGIKNYCISVKEKGDDIIFLRKIIRGGADESYGIQVAKLAGVPTFVIDRAKDLLKQLEQADITKAERKLKKNKNIEGQFDLFVLDKMNKHSEEVIEKLRNTNVSLLTPMDAMNLLYELQQKVKKG